ncbi:MAG: DUF4190 domain-containing protein [Clostridia bacterium]|nr:DUF4190 domain-containing protein [Clostridia bacterium]
MNYNPYDNNGQAEHDDSVNHDLPAQSSNDNSSFGNSDDNNPENPQDFENPYQFTDEPEVNTQPYQGMAITSMILAIISMTCCGGFIPAIVALILSSVARKNGNTSGFAIAGKIIGTVSVILYGIAFLYMIALIALSVVA